MKPTPQAIENAARAHAKLRCQLSHSDVEFLPSDRLYAEAILRSDLGDMVLVPKEATAAMLVAATDLDEVVGGALYTAHPGSVYRAMIAAAEDSNDQG